jgi:DNA-binding NarL/FixJ family response regulator
MPSHLKTQGMPRPVTALIVDDEPHVFVYLSALLKQLGVHTVWHAADGSAALEQVAAHKPDVVLLDMNLPQVSGLQLLAKFKAEHPKMPVIVVSVVSTMETVSQACELGADAYVLKHLPKAQVFQMLSNAFDKIGERSSDGTAGDGKKPTAPV